MVGLHPDTRPDADIRRQFQQNCTSASAPAPASGYPSAAAGIRAGILGYPPSKGPATDRLEGLPSSRPSPLPAAGILWDTRIPASDLRKRGHPHPNPHPLAGIRWHRRVSATDTLRPSLLESKANLLACCWNFATLYIDNSQFSVNSTPELQVLVDHNRVQDHKFFQGGL
ncbi:hypothetical protein PGT21_035129 [Puccinia graminis f. sp. tritici]|uniref:Uncharacterized protein n=1 Tax=Puccinia graminis f. sp. tritici TaxID=56615 RepID=A0A5B0QD07_PUCGR|nr:hypothetical protein PGT21_035129 [Puccinia graminis f. sp. tritici]